MEILMIEIYTPTLYIYYIVISVIVGFLLKLFIPFFHNKNWLDHVNERKNHEGSIPRAGGIAMFIGFTIGLILGLSPPACLTLAVAFSSYYVSTAKSPSLFDIDNFIRNWN